MDVTDGAGPSSRSNWSTASVSVYQQSMSSTTTLPAAKPGRVSSLFSTARGSSVCISEQALQKSHQLLATASTSSTVEAAAANGSHTPATPSVRPAASSVYSTSVYSVEVGGLTTPRPVLSSGPTNGTTPRTSSLLRTAGGKNVLISDSAAKRGQHILSQAPASTDESIRTPRNAPNSSSNLGSSSAPRQSSLLQTAGGKNVLISDSAARRSQLILMQQPSTNNENLRTPQNVYQPSIALNSAAYRTNGIRPPAVDPGMTADKRYDTLPRARPNPLWAPLSSSGARPNGSSTLGEYPASSSSSSRLSAFSEARNPQPSRISSALYLDRASLLNAVVDEWDYYRLENSSVNRPQYLAKIYSYNAGYVDFDEAGEYRGTVTTESVHWCSRVVSILKADKGEEGPHEWIKMQLRWIIWTLASFERRYPVKYVHLLCWENVVRLVRARLSAYQMTPSARPATTPVSASKYAKYGKRHCSRSFSYARPLSPLQKCCEICCWQWPMVVCISVSPANSASGDMSKRDRQIQITDGWWWAPVVLDSGLMNLVFKVCHNSLYTDLDLIPVVMFSG
jgi:hypothetical protein